MEVNGPVVGPGALKPTVGDRKKSSRLLVHIVIDILLFLLCTYLGVGNNNKVGHFSCG